ncbi:transporter, major facilitator family protein [Teladorsagia circumcincta]|uniref:Transporter, major facilitator family protein n=1 Tax=Teladorsagia circumcincta TaxID=45464 RepID=A0A2G9UGY1_TELCI|nr:transporter, major facilitator family protein [Teladorsagia circumcincta]
MAEVPSTAKRTRLVPIQPDGGWGWVVVMGTFFIHVVADGFVYSFGVLVDVLMKEFESDNTVIAMIVSLLTGFTLGSGPLASAVCNKYGCRATAITGAIIAITGCTASYFASEMWHIIVSVGIIMGIGSGFMYCPAIVIVTMYFEKRRSLATGIAVTGAGVGTMVFSPINDYVMSRYGWRAVFLVFNAHNYVQVVPPLTFINRYRWVGAWKAEAIFRLPLSKCTSETFDGSLSSFAIERRGVFALCVVCGSLFRPLQFQEIIEEEGAEIPDEVNKPNAISEEVTSALLPAGGAPLSSKDVAEDSQSLASLASSRADSKCRRKLVVRRESVGERDVGYLNRKDIFYTGAITSVGEFREDPDKYSKLRKRTYTNYRIWPMSAIENNENSRLQNGQDDV